MATFNICSIDGCDNRVYGHGMCQKHWQRMKRRGTLEVDGTERGTVMQWLETVAIPYTGQDCLPFPFAKNRSGYGRISGKFRRSSLAHIFVAERVHGDRPTTDHCALHSCGNGHLGCCNPNHLYWGTLRDNAADAKRHGTFSPPPCFRGEDNARALITEEQARSIKHAVIRDGCGIAETARRFGVPYYLVANIKYEKSWRHVE